MWADFARHFKAAPDRLGPEQVRAYQLFLVQRKKLSWSRFNQTVCALRFFYHDVLHRNWMIEHIPYPRHEQKLPTVLSPVEVAEASLCAGHAQQLGGESPPPNLMEVKG